MLGTSNPAEEVAASLRKDEQIQLGHIHLLDGGLQRTSINVLPHRITTIMRACGAIKQMAAGPYHLTPRGRQVLAACYHRRKMVIDYEFAELERARLERDAKALPEVIQQTLRGLVGVEDHMVELNLIKLPRDERQLLAEAGVIDLRPQLNPDDDVELKLTDQGRKIINACRRLHMSDDERRAAKRHPKRHRRYFNSPD